MKQQMLRPVTHISVSSISEQESYQYLCLLRQEGQIFNYFKHTLLTQVIKIVPGHAFFDTLKCHENAPFSSKLRPTFEPDYSTLEQTSFFQNSFVPQNPLY